jgi:hypothetical protein
MTDQPNPGTSPSSASLLRSTALAIAVAGVLLVTCVLPAEYGKDPTGIGRVLGLTQMGEVKLALAEEAAANAAAEASADSVIAAAEAGTGTAPADAAAAPVADVPERTDTTLVTLAPTKGGEIKLVLQGNVPVRYQWSVTGGVVNYDMHGDSTNAPKDWFVSYRKGQGVAADSGELTGGFNGNHGWYWRNRGRSDVLITLITTGRYARIDRHL